MCGALNVFTMDVMSVIVYEYDYRQMTSMTCPMCRGTVGKMKEQWVLALDQKDVSVG